jgi:xylulokinase
MRFEEIADHVRVKNTFTPNPQHRKLYDELFAEFLNIYKRNKAIFKRLNAIK